MNSFQNKVAAVTGASSGIGRAVALELAKNGCDLAICARSRMDALEETARAIKKLGRRATVHQVDMGARDQVEGFCAETLKEHGQVDMVVNNAGVGLVAPIEEMAYEDFEWVMQTNFWGMVYGTKAFLPYLKNRPEAVIANISSVWGFWAFPVQSAYTVSKFAIRGFTEALAQELARTGISVSLVMPGGIRTDIAKNSRLRAALGPVKGEKEIIRFFNLIARTTPERAARVIARGMQKKKSRILIGPDAHVLDLANRMFPSWYQKVLPLLF